MLSGQVSLPRGFDPVSWHAHEFLFGYLGAVIAGFPLTAVPNWTGRLSIVGWRLGLRALLWLAGRGAVAGPLPSGVATTVDLAFPVVLAAAIGREIVARKNWRNLIVLIMLAVFALGNGLYHWEAGRGDYAAQGYGLRLGLAAGVMMIAVIGGRIVPSFTRNWLARRGPRRLPSAPMQGFDKVAPLVLLAALLLWVALPFWAGTGSLLGLAGALHVLRLARWAGLRTAAEPLVMVLHAGYAYLPLGALALAAEILLPGVFSMAPAQHLWMGGAVGLMRLAVMTRAKLGHTGQDLHACPGTVAIYLALVTAVLARVTAGLWSDEATLFHSLAGLAWIAAFGDYAVVYGRLLLRLPPAKRI